MPEEEAFWALTVLCEDMFSHYFTPDMLGSMTDQHVFEDLVAEHFRKLNAHLESIQLPLVLISFPWFMCLFIGYLPMQARAFLPIACFLPVIHPPLPHDRRAFVF